jgi:protein subunit release factor B
MEKQTKIVQITAGRGPVECCRVVAKVLELMLKDASKNNITTAELLHKEQRYTLMEHYIQLRLKLKVPA